MSFLVFKSENDLLSIRYSILESHIRPDLAQSKCRVRYCNVIVTKNRWLVSIEMVKILLSQIQNCGISIELSRFGFTASLSYSLPRVHPFKSSCFWFDTVSLIHPTRPKTSTINLNSHNLGFTLTKNCTFNPKSAYFNSSVFHPYSYFTPIFTSPDVEFKDSYLDRGSPGRKKMKSQNQKKKKSHQLTPRTSM